MVALNRVVHRGLALSVHLVRQMVAELAEELADAGGVGLPASRDTAGARPSRRVRDQPGRIDAALGGQQADRRFDGVAVATAIIAAEKPAQRVFSPKPGQMKRPSASGGASSRGRSSADC
jgi:hypothetical protein